MLRSTPDSWSFRAEKLLVIFAEMHKKSRKEQGCHLHQLQPASLVVFQCCTLGNVKHIHMIGVYIWGYFRTM